MQSRNIKNRIKDWFDPVVKMDEEYPAHKSHERIDDGNNDGIQVIRDDELPSPLKKLQTKQLILAAIDILVVTLILIHFKTPQCAFLYVIAAWLGWQAITIRRNYKTGEIVEVAAVCQSAKYSTVRKILGGGYTRVIFETPEDEPEFLRFNLPGAVRDMDIGSVYVLYFKKSEPNKLLTYVAV